MKRALAALLAPFLVTTAHAGVDTSIYDIQNGLIPPNDPVTVEGVVVTGVFAFGFYAQEPLQESGSYARGGIWCFNGGQPNVTVGDVVDIQATYVEFFFESELDMTGAGSFTVVGAAAVPPPTVLTITDLNNGGSGAEPPKGWANGEEWEGVLVRVELPDMVSTETLATGCFSMSPTRWGLYQTSAPAESLFVRNSVATHEIPLPGSTITFVQGPMSYHRCNRKVIPRDNDDVGYTGPPNVVWAYSTPTGLALTGGTTTTAIVQFSRDVEETSAENVNNYLFLSGLGIQGATRDDADHSIVHLVTDAQPDAVQDEIFVQNVVSEGEGGVPMPSGQSFQFHTGHTTIPEIQFVAKPLPDPLESDDSAFLNSVVSTIGVATTSTFNTSTSDFSIGVEPETFRGVAGGFTGLRVGLGGGGVDIGDLVRVSGTVVEPFGRTTIDFVGYGDFEVMGTAAVPTPVSFATPEALPYNDIAESERWEDVLVVIEEAVLDSTEFSQFGEWALLAAGAAAAPGDTAKLDHTSGSVSQDFGWEPCKGNTILLRGIVEFSFSQYKVIPRMNGDVSHLAFGPNCVVSTGEVTSPIRSGARSYPNPFNPTTTIEFTTPADGYVTLDIYDAKGRRVRTVVAGDTFEAGTHEVRWDGANDSGTPLASGTYFYRIVLEGEIVTDRMTLVK